MWSGHNSPQTPRRVARDEMIWALGECEVIEQDYYANDAELQRFLEANGYTISDANQCLAVPQSVGGET